MPLLNDIHSLIVPVASANFTAHTYTEIYAGQATTVAINGVSVTMGAGSSIKIKINSVSGGTGCYLLGETIDNRTGSNDLSFVGKNYTY
jgi:hypothetical protein